MKGGITMAEEMGTSTVETQQEAAVEEQPQQVEQVEKTYSESELQDLLQKESDRRVTQALAKQRKEYEKKLSLAALNGNERADAEKDLTIRDLTEQIETYKRREQVSDLKIALQAQGLPASMAEYFNFADENADAAKYVDSLAKAVQSAVQSEVKRRLSTGKPHTAAAADETITREQFKAMTLRQQAELYAKSPELYKQLIK